MGDLIWPSESSHLTPAPGHSTKWAVTPRWIHEKKEAPETRVRKDLLFYINPLQIKQWNWCFLPSTHILLERMIYDFLSLPVVLSHSSTSFFPVAWIPFLGDIFTMGQTLPCTPISTVLVVPVGSLSGTTWFSGLKVAWPVLFLFSLSGFGAGWGAAFEKNRAFSSWG